MRMIALAALAFGAAEASAQAPIQPDAARRFALVPHVSVGTVGHRWETASADAKLGFGRRPMLGTALEIRLPGRWTAELLGAVTSTDYTLEDAGAESIRGTGQIHLARFGAGVLIRMREDVPGYFSVGLGGLYYRPVVRIAGPTTDEDQRVDRFSDDVQWMPALHFGAGVDFDVEGRGVRVDGRFYGSRPGQDSVCENRITECERTFQARDMVMDFALSVGIIFPF